MASAETYPTAIRCTLGGLLAFGALNAFAGGYFGMSGAKGVPIDWLAGSPFSDYTVPSVILFVFVGGSFFLASVAVLARLPIARRAAFGAGVVVLVWMAVQMAVIGYVSWMQPATGMAGVLVVVLGWWLPQSDARRDDRRVRFLLDALFLGAAIVTGVVSRRPVRPHGDEDRRPLPGDDLLPAANGRWTHAITIRAQPRDIWPWLAQMGCGRAGWYSYDALDNGGVPSADRIQASMQRVEVGDLFPWTPTADDGFMVRLVEPERALVLGGNAGSRYRVAWAFVLERIDDTSTRLLTRVSGEYTRPAVALFLWLIVRPIDFGMQRKQLLNLKARVEASRGRL